MRLESRFRWLPTPFRSLLLFVVWLLLNNSVSPGHLILAALFAFFIPVITFPFREPQPLIIRPGLAVKQFLIVLYDIITASLQVALLILGPVKKLPSGICESPAGSNSCNARSQSWQVRYRLRQVLLVLKFTRSQSHYRQMKSQQSVSY